MRKILKSSILFLLTILLTVSLFSCSSNLVAGKYDKDWMLGKTSSEIENRYGKFDLLKSRYSINEKGDYIKCGCGYITKKVGKNASKDDEFFMIYFDENGVAYEFKENYPRPGG